MEPFSSHTRSRFTAWWVLSFYALAIYKLLHGMWQFQMQPHFFNTRFDGITWLFMQTGIHQWAMNNPNAWILLDVAFYAMPMLYWLAFRKNMRWAAFMAVVMLIVNWTYVQCFTLFPTNSIEGHVGWLLYPFVLMTVNLRSFYYLMHGMRYLFLFFFASAGLWKIYQGGVFNLEQMSAILLMQHKEFMVSDPQHWYTHLIEWLVGHPTVSYLLYLTGTLLELFFIVGFFTKRYDRLLFLLFIAFLLMDLFIMRIPYFEVLPMTLPFFFSKYAEPK